MIHCDISRMLVMETNIEGIILAAIETPGNLGQIGVQMRRFGDMEVSDSMPAVVLNELGCGQLLFHLLSRLYKLHFGDRHHQIRPSTNGRATPR
jgi:hypothetical protein